MQMQGSPEWDLIEELSPDCPNESLNERIRERYIGNCLDLRDPQDPKIGFPSLELE